MGDYISSKDLDRGEALTGVARQQAEKRKAEIEKALKIRAEMEELKLEQAVAAELKKQKMVKSKRQTGGKKTKR